MNILISTNIDNALQSYVSIAKAFVYAGHDVTIWDNTNVNSKSAYDVFDELKPVIFINRGRTTTEEKLCNEYQTIDIKASSLLCADLFLFKRIIPNQEALDLFACDNCVIISGDRSEIKYVNNLGIIGPNATGKTKLFSPHTYMYPQYCQGLPEDLYSLALSCADRAYATSFQNLYNFTLANPNTYYSLYGEETLSVDRILTTSTNFHHAQTLSDVAGLDIDFMKSLDKFMETY